LSSSPPLRATRTTRDLLMLALARGGHRPRHCSSALDDPSPALQAERRRRPDPHRDLRPIPRRIRMSRTDDGCPFGRPPPKRVERRRGVHPSTPETLLRSVDGRESPSVAAKRCCIRSPQTARQWYSWDWSPCLVRSLVPKCGSDPTLPPIPA
jgi:hypothetical protein